MQARLPVLATYLGHASIDGTQHYLQMTAELYPEIVSRSQRRLRRRHPAQEVDMKPTDLSVHVTNFLTRYLAGQRNLSPNTIKAYRDVFTLLLRFGRDGRGIAVERLSLADIDVAFVEAFLDHLAQERHCSIRTLNQRLAVLHAFFRYVQSEVPERMLQCQKIMAMPLRRHVQTPCGYLSKDELDAGAGAPRSATPAGRRDAVMLSVLYDTGARAQELIDLNADDVRLTSPAQVRLLGKGRKVRVVPLMDATAQLLRDHLRENATRSARARPPAAVPEPPGRTVVALRPALPAALPRAGGQVGGTRLHAEGQPPQPAAHQGHASAAERRVAGDHPRLPRARGREDNADLRPGKPGDEATRAGEGGRRVAVGVAAVLAAEQVAARLAALAVDRRETCPAAPARSGAAGVLCGAGAIGLPGGRGFAGLAAHNGGRTSRRRRFACAHAQGRAPPRCALRDRPGRCGPPRTGRMARPSAARTCRWRTDGAGRAP